MASSSDARVSLDEVRDFLYVNLRATERFALTLKATVEQLEQCKPSDEWLDTAAEQLEKGGTFFSEQQRGWEQQRERMTAYIDSVRALADELAIKDLQLNPGPDGEGTPAQDARMIHPELRRFKLEKTARITGKYGGSPALGAMVLPQLHKEMILKATGTPAAREIRYSKTESKDAAQLAEVMRFKREKKEEEEQLAGWQDELVARRGKMYLEEQQAKGVQPENAPVSPIVNKQLAALLEKRQASVDAAQEEAAKEEEAAKKAASLSPALQGELADKFSKRQAALAASFRQEAEAAAEAAAAEAELQSAPATPAFATPLTAELTNVLWKRKVAAASSGGAEGHQGAGSEAATPAAASGSAEGSRQSSTPGSAAPWTSPRPQVRPPPGATPIAGAATNELMARLQRIRKTEEEQEANNS